MRHVTTVRPATAFPFVLGVFSGSLITVFLFLAVRSIDELEAPPPGMEAREDGPGEVNRIPGQERLPVRESVPQAQLPMGTSESKAVFFPRQAVSYNVLTSMMETRGLAIQKTWASGAKMKNLVEFYLLPSAQLEDELLAIMKKKVRIIPLQETKEEDNGNYDHQGVFGLWRDVCKRKLNNYHWFVRLKDNVYLQPDKLEKLLNSLNSSKPILVGRSVTPLGYRRDELGLRTGESYCFEGGYVASWRTLELVCPFLSACQEGAKSENEDVEIARCIKEHTGINCTANTEVHICVTVSVCCVCVCVCVCVSVCVLCVCVCVCCVCCVCVCVCVCCVCVHTYQFKTCHTIQ